MQEQQLRYLQLLSEQYPTIQSTSNAIINLSAQLQLPKGTEHFLSDMHGEYEAFQHVLRNGAGSIRRRIEELFANSLSRQEQQNLATLIYYPEQKTALLLQSAPDPDEWSRLTLLRLIKLARLQTSKYQRTTVRSYLPSHVAPILEDLLYEQESMDNKAAY